MQHDANDLITLFNQLFQHTESTILIGGADEPFYQASTQANIPNQLFFRADYFSSALHEIAHWCIAGAERRKLDDYGYWYSPDGRSIEQQDLFEQVEIKPQAIECLFSTACGIRFHVSLDNLNGDVHKRASTKPSFASVVERQVEVFLNQPETLPKRAQLFIERLYEFYDLWPRNTTSYIGFSSSN